MLVFKIGILSVQLLRNVMLGWLIKAKLVAPLLYIMHFANVHQMLNYCKNPSNYEWSYLIPAGRGTICFLEAEFINPRDVPSHGRSRDTTSYLIYKEIKTIFCLTKYWLFMPLSSPLTQCSSLFLFLIDHLFLFPQLKMLRTTQNWLTKKIPCHRLSKISHGHSV